MRLVCCAKGHFYDAESGNECPYCHEKGARARRTISPRLERVAADGLELIGHGAASDVYRAGERCALKVVNSDRMPELAGSIRREIGIMRRLTGLSGVVELLDHEIVDSASGADYAWLLMPYYTPFPKYLSGRELSARERLDCVAQLCRVLARCRDAGVVHLDVQPKNIYVDNEGGVLLGDFGVSLFIEELATHRERRGTLAYMAPEVHRHGLCGEHSDIYSLGLVLYGLFNGRVLPFMDICDRDEAIRRRLSGEAFPDARCGSESLARRVMAIVRRACDPDAGARYPRFEAMEAALRQAMEAPAPMDMPPSSTHDPLEGLFRFDTDPVATSRARPYTEPANRSGASPNLFDADTVTTSMAAPFTESDESYTCFGTCGPDAPDMSYDTGGPGGSDTCYGASGPSAPDMGYGAGGPGMPDMCYGASGPDGSDMCYGAGSPGAFDASFFDGDLNATTLPLSARSGAPADGAALKTDRVEFTAVAPKTFVRGEYAMVDIIMYEAAFRAVVDDLIRQSDEPVREKRGGVAEVTRQDKVRVVLSAPDVQIEEDEQTMPWQGGYLDFSFAVLLPEDFSRQQLLFTARVYVNEVPRMRLMFTAKVDSAQVQTLEVFKRQVMSAFVSYASQDRRRVAAMIQGMQKICPEMDIFFDINSLHSGEYWEQTLRREIDRRDVLFLCWSRNASKSEWVEKEWRYALERKGLDGIEPLPIEPADVCPPPPELGSMHFNDMMLYIIGPNTWDGMGQGE